MKKESGKVAIIILIVVLVLAGVAVWFFKDDLFSKKTNKEETNERVVVEENTKEEVTETTESIDEMSDDLGKEGVLQTKLNEKINGEIIRSFYGDFNGDEASEMWALVWDEDGVLYDDVLGQTDSWDLADKCAANEYQLETGKEYNQLQVWYVDESDATMVDVIQSIKLTEEYVNGTSTEWGEDTFYYLCDLDARMISFGDQKHLFVEADHTWMTARGWGLYLDESSYMYENENGPKCTSNKNDPFMRFEEYDNGVCISEHAEYELCKGEYVENADYFYYPVSYENGMYVETSSTSVTLSQVESLQGYDEIYKEAMEKDKSFERDEYGSAGNVIYTFTASDVSFDEYLYNNNGYIYLNGTAKGSMDEWSSGMMEDDIYDAEIDVCLELKVEDGVVTSYRWLGDHQKAFLTDFEKVESVFSK